MDSTTEDVKDTIEEAKEILKESEEKESGEVKENITEIKIEPTSEELAEEEKTAAAYLDRLQRTMAEFDNYRKRTEKEKNARYDMGLTDTVLTILPVLDNFERALIAPCTDTSYVKGMEMIYKQMLDLLDSIEVKQIPALNEQFDTNVHNAVMHVEDDAYGENEIIEELQKGYIYKDEKVIRYSMVKVAN